MATKTSTQDLDTLVINRVTSEAAYQDMVSNGQVNENELYFVEGDVDPLPSQAGNSGKFLTTNGSAASWATVDALPSQSGNSGKFLTTNGSAASWATVDALPSQSGNSGKFLTTNGSAASWADAPKEVFMAEYGVTTYDEVYDAYNAGKIIYLKNSSPSYLYFPLVDAYPLAPGTEYKVFYFYGYHYDAECFCRYDLLPYSPFWKEPYSIHYAYSDHQHGSLTSDGKIGSTADYAVYTTTNGAITAGSLATSDPTASGTSTSFIATASQDSKGKMTLTKASLPTASSSVAGITTVGASGGAAAYSHGDHIPTQTGNSGKFLTTNGSAASWASAPEEVFVAEYGVTTYADVLAAYQAGKTIIAKYSPEQNVDVFYTCVFKQYDPNSNITNFQFVTPSALGYSDFLIDSYDGWSTVSTMYFANQSHAGPSTTYGVGTGSYYGHVKLSDSTSSTSGNSGGIAATPAAVKAAYDLASGKAGVYSTTFTTSNWSNQAITVAASTHGCGTSPMVQVFTLNGSNYELYHGYPSDGWKVSVDSSGNITLSVSASGLEFNGKIVVR